MIGREQPPNILFIMSDEHAPMFSGVHGHAMVQTPNLDALASEGVVFESAYCNAPVCVPSRMSLLTGRYPHNVSVWDNASPLASDVPTWPYYLRGVGIDCVLSGKQHFIGPDVLHGFRSQLSRDIGTEWIIPIDDWREPLTPRNGPWPELTRAGPGRSVNIDVDDDVEAAARSFMAARRRRGDPWALCVSFLAPHFPLVVPTEYWERYPVDEVDMPVIPSGHLKQMHPVWQRMRASFGMLDITDELTRRGRAAYYGLITQLDERVGRLLACLEATGQAERTLVVYTSDHGEMAGEHGMWRKGTFYEQSARVPLIMRWPEGLPRGGRVGDVISLVDLTATLLDVAGVTPTGDLDGASLLSLARGTEHRWKNEAFALYTANGVREPIAMLRRGRYKLNYMTDHEPELYDLASDPQEFDDLARDPNFDSVRTSMEEALLRTCDPEALGREVRKSQAERLAILRGGGWSTASQSERPTS